MKVNIVNAYVIQFAFSYIHLFHYSMELNLKGNKKSKPIVFETGGPVREEAKIKAGRVQVGDGLSADSSLSSFL